MPRKFEKVEIDTLHSVSKAYNLTKLCCVNTASAPRMVRAPDVEASCLHLPVVSSRSSSAFLNYQSNKYVKCTCLSWPASDANNVKKNTLIPQESRRRRHACLLLSLHYRAELPPPGLSVAEVHLGYCFFFPSSVTMRRIAIENSYAHPQPLFSAATQASCGIAFASGFR